MSDRVSSVYVEHCHIDRAENAVVFVNKERTVRLPAAFIAVLLIGPGTRVTHGAMRLLGESGTAVCWVGEHGVRCYAAGFGPNRGAGLVIRQAYLVSRPVERLAVARRMYAMRFPGEDVSRATMQQLRGREGARVRRLYREHSQRTGVPWDARRYKPGDAFAEGDDINRLLSAGHTCLYAVCHAVVAALGASAALGFVHTGSAVSFVLDIADLYKADTTIPASFDLVAEGRTEEGDIRRHMRDMFADGNLMRRIVRDVTDLLGEESGGHADPSVDVGPRLWDESGHSVPGGVDWSRAEIEVLSAGGHVVLSGPEVPDSEVRE